jgi:trehalose utilization protein
VRVIVWSDDAAGQALEPPAARLHPDGIAVTIASALRESLGTDAAVAVAGLHESNDGLPEAKLADADVLIWWGHEAHDQVAQDTIDRVQRHVLGGLGLLVLHSAHHSEIFRRLTGTSCDLQWREANDEELIWTVEPSHPIAAGIESPIRLERHEMYGEPFDIPAPDRLVFISSFTGGEVFRSGCCFQRGGGRIFYFGPGHESDPVYEHPQIRRVLANAVMWAKRAQ